MKLHWLDVLTLISYLLVIERNPQEIPSNLINKKFPDFESNSLFENGKFTLSEKLNNKIEAIIINIIKTEMVFVFLTKTSNVS